MGVIEQGADGDRGDKCFCVNVAAQEVSICHQLGLECLGARDAGQQAAKGSDRRKDAQV